MNGLRIRGGHYMFGDNAIGHDIETAVDYLKNPKNQDIVLSLKARLQGTTSSVKSITKDDTKMPKKAKKEKQK